MGAMRRYPLARIFCFFLVVLAYALSAQAQDSQADERNATSFIDSVAKTVYGLAWPTASYRKVAYDSIDPADGGFDVVVKISGLSGIDNSDLWLRVAFMFRNGKFYDIRVKDHNAFWVPPFATTTTLAGVAANLAKSYAESQRANGGESATPPPPSDPSPAPTYTAPTYTPPTYTPPPTYAAPDNSTVPAPNMSLGTMTDDSNLPSADGACLTNRTNHVLSFEYRWGESQWQADKLEPNFQEELYWKFASGQGTQASPQLMIRYLDDSAPDSPLRIYNLDRSRTSQPPACESLKNYHVGAAGAAMLLYTGPS
jgi:hypothetical protein